MSIDERKQEILKRQRERRSKLMRIDYAPSQAMRRVIEAERVKRGKDWNAAEFLDQCVKEWAEIYG